MIHHLEDPPLALAKDGPRGEARRKVLIWVYGREGNSWLVWLLDPLRRALFARLPVASVHHLSLYPTVLLWLALRLGVRPIEYFKLLARFDFAHLRSIVFDQMLPRVAHYWPRETVVALMEGAGLDDVRLAVGERDVLVGDRHQTASDRAMTRGARSAGAEDIGRLCRHGLV